VLGVVELPVGEELVDDVPALVAEPPSEVATEVPTPAPVAGSIAVNVAASG
jgi:hypothetical protein